jgi:hypothetical protein
MKYFFIILFIIWLFSDPFEPIGKDGLEEEELGTFK